MKDLKDIIQEKLKVGSKTQIHTRNPEDWSIVDAEDGDIVEIDDTLLFIYKGLNKDYHVNNAGPNAIVYHATYICDNRKKLEVITDTGVGEITNRPERYKLASPEKCEEFYQALDKAGYKWDETKLEVIKK